MESEKYMKVNPLYHEVKKSERLLGWEREYPSKYWDYRREWSERPERQKPGKFPLHLDLESTRRCNLRCPMCPRTIKIKRGEVMEEGDMDLGLYKKIIDEGSKKGLRAVKLNYLGEPLMCRNLTKMVAYAKRKGILDVMFNTNGVLLTEEMSERLIGAGLDRILLSFDSPVKEKYESIRIGARFEQVIDNFKTLVRFRDEGGFKHPILRVSMVLMKENESDLPDFIKLWTPIADKIAYVDYENPQQMDMENRYTIQLKPHAGFVCSQLYQRLVIQHDGKIGLCCEDYDAKADLGSAWTDSIGDVWLGERLRAVRRLHNEGGWHRVSPCDVCNIPYV